MLRFGLHAYFINDSRVGIDLGIATKIRSVDNEVLQIDIVLNDRLENNSTLIFFALIQHNGLQAVANPY